MSFLLRTHWPKLVMWLLPVTNNPGGKSSLCSIQGNSEYFASSTNGSCVSTQQVLIAGVHFTCQSAAVRFPASSLSYIISFLSFVEFFMLLTCFSL